MNSKFALLATSVALALISLALFITAVGGTASSGSGVGSDFEIGALIRDSPNNRLLADQRRNISQDVPLQLTEPISIYLPLLDNEYIYVRYPAERAALMAIYYAAEGDSWSNNTGWGSETSYCTWTGVTCDSETHVTSLYLIVRGGRLAAEIGDLPYLTKLSIGGEYVCRGKLCNYYGLTGAIPPEIGKLSHLQELGISYAGFSSPLPAQIGNLENLRGLYLIYTYAGFIPAEIGNLHNLEILILTGSGLSGPIPPELGNLVNLQVLRLPYNQLSGGIPPEIGNLGNLRILNMEYNSLEGSIPPGIGNLASLNELRLRYNQLTGSIPPHLGNLNDLQILDLGVNQLTGTIADELGNLGNLLVLDLVANQISGTIPAELSKMVNLNDLLLGDNPDLTCWETQEARDWALSLPNYVGPACYTPLNIYLPACFRH